MYVSLLPLHCERSEESALPGRTKQLRLPHLSRPLRKVGASNSSGHACNPARSLYSVDPSRSCHPEERALCVTKDLCTCRSCHCHSERSEESAFPGRTKQQRGAPSFASFAKGGSV